jgi:GT2 family glycosyltransferase/glycosyltransferase involved in cell wall biosynthesis
MRIGFVTERMLTGFGVDLCVDLIADGLARRGHEVIVYCSSDDGSYAGRGYRIRATPIHASKFFPAMDREGARWSKLLDHEGLDVVSIHTFPFFSMIPKLSTPTVAVDYGVSLTDGMPLWLRTDFAYVNWSLYNRYLPKATEIVTISNFLRGRMPKNLAGRAEVIHLGAEHYWREVTEQQRREYRRGHGVTDDQVLALYVGRLNQKGQPYKGVEELLGHIRALREEGLPAALMCVGFGSHADAGEIGRAGGIAVLSAPPSEMALAYSAADVFTTCSKWEGFGLPLIEAHRFGLPSVAYAAGAHPEIAVVGKTALLVDTAEQFRTEWRALVKDPASRHAMGEVARAHAAHFTWERTVDAHERVLLRAAQQSETGVAQMSVSSADREVETEPLVSVVVVCFEPEERHLVACVDSVLASDYSKVELVLVDNGSTNGVAAAMANDDPRVKFLPLTTNTGFAGGINRGLESSTGSLILLLNPDAAVDPGAIRLLVEASRRRPNAIGFAPKMLFVHDHDLIDSVGIAIDDGGAAFNRGIGQLDIGQYDVEEPVFGACFGAAMIRRDAFDRPRVGPMDEDYFLYYEDVDWCLRATLFGEEFWTAPAARVYHVHSATTKAEAYDFKYRLIERNLFHTVFKNFERRRTMRIFVKRSRSHMRNILHRRMAGASFKALVQGWMGVRRYWQARRTIQRRRVRSDNDIFKLSYGENPFFDPTHYAPIYNWDTLVAMLRRLWVVTGEDRWARAYAYVQAARQTPLRFRPRQTRLMLKDIAGPLPAPLAKFFDALERQPGMMAAEDAAPELEPPELASAIGPEAGARSA